MQIVERRRAPRQLARRGPLPPRHAPLAETLGPRRNALPIGRFVDHQHQRQLRGGGAQRIEVHAWLVTWPIWGSSTTTPPDAQHPYNRHPEWLTQDSSGTKWNGSQYCFDPGHPGAASHTFRIAMNLVTNYDLDFVQTCLVPFAFRRNRVSVGAGDPHTPGTFSFETWGSERTEGQAEGMLATVLGGCFCESCHAAAKAQGIDMAALRPNLDHCTMVSGVAPKTLLEAVKAMSPAEKWLPHSRAAAGMCRRVGRGSINTRRPSMKNMASSSTIRSRRCATTWTR